MDPQPGSAPPLVGGVRAEGTSLRLPQAVSPRWTPKSVCWLSLLSLAENGEEEAGRAAWRGPPVIGVAFVEQTPHFTDGETEDPRGAPGLAG